MNLISWVKQNQLATLLLIIFTFFILKTLFGNFYGYDLKYSSSNFEMPMATSMDEESYSRNNFKVSSSTQGIAAPAPEISQRMVIQSSQMSLLVSDVKKTLEAISSYAQSIGGYMVESTLDRPEESASGRIAVRVPQKKLNEALAYFNAQAVKVVSQTLEGADVTDEYVDNQARLAILDQNKARFEEIMAKAVTVQEILQVQNEIFNLQSQIDQIKGQQEYLQKSAQMVKITIYLAEDELSLPYVPDNAWRPDVIFKQAVRNLISLLRGLGSIVIWIGVFSVLWLPVVVGVLFYKKYYTNKKLAKNPS